MIQESDGAVLIDKQYLAAQLENGSLVNIKDFVDLSKYYDVLNSTTCFWKVKPPYTVMIMLTTPVIVPMFNK